MRTVTTSSRSWLLFAFAALGVLSASACGRAAPEGDLEIGASPDPAAEAVNDSIEQTEPSSQAEPSDDTAEGQMDESAEMTDQMADSSDAAQTQTSTPVTAPVIVTAENLSGLVDQSPDRAGVRVTSSAPVVAPEPVVQTSTSIAPVNPGVHIVQAGDSLSVIAEMYGIPVDAIATANGLENVNSIKPGQELIIPSG